MLRESPVRWVRLLGHEDELWERWTPTGTCTWVTGSCAQARKVLCQPPNGCSRCDAFTPTGSHGACSLLRLIPYLTTYSERCWGPQWEAARPSLHCTHLGQGQASRVSRGLPAAPAVCVMRMCMGSRCLCL